jgi:hypothetical protein
MLKYNVSFSFLKKKKKRVINEFFSKYINSYNNFLYVNKNFFFSQLSNHNIFNLYFFTLKNFFFFRNFLLYISNYSMQLYKLFFLYGIYSYYFFNMYYFFNYYFVLKNNNKLFNLLLNDNDFFYYDDFFYYSKYNKKKNKINIKKCILHLIEKRTNNFLNLRLFKTRKVVVHVSGGQGLSRALNNSKKYKKGTRVLVKIIERKIKKKVKILKLRNLYIISNKY